MTTKWCAHWVFGYRNCDQPSVEGFDRCVEHFDLAAAVRGVQAMAERVARLEEQVAQHHRSA